MNLYVTGSWNRLVRTSNAIIRDTIRAFMLAAVLNEVSLVSSLNQYTKLIGILMLSPGANIVKLSPVLLQMTDVDPIYGYKQAKRAVFAALSMAATNGE